MVTIREATPADCRALAEIQVDSQYAEYGAVLPQEYLGRYSYSDQEREWAELMQRNTGEILLVGDDNGKLAGYVLGWPDDEGPLGFEAELAELNVRLAVHHTDLAERLVRELARRLREQGASSVMSWILEGSMSLAATYQTLGAQQVTEHEWNGNEEYDVHLHQVGYGWSDINVLCD